MHSLTLSDTFPKLDISNAAFCIFIEGLDEYKGDKDDLVDTMRTLSNMNVKLCVASRPENVFELAFGRVPDYKPYLQDLNKPDIARYVNDKLTSRSDFKELRASDAKADELVKEIVQKS